MFAFRKSFRLPVRKAVGFGGSDFSPDTIEQRADEKATNRPSVRCKRRETPDTRSQSGTCGAIAFPRGGFRICTATPRKANFYPRVRHQHPACPRTTHPACAGKYRGSVSEIPKPRRQDRSFVDNRIGGSYHQEKRLPRRRLRSFSRASELGSRARNPRRHQPVEGFRTAQD